MKYPDSRKISTIALWLGAASLISFTFVFIIKFWPYQVEAPLATEILDHYGSLIGGLVGSLFSLASIFLIIHQLKEQDKIISAQSLNEQRQKVESRFFELLKTHRENLNEIQIGEKIGKYAIQMMVRELRVCIEMAEKVNARPGFQFDEKDVLNFGYLAFYFGCVVIPNEKTTKTFRQQVRGFAPTFIDEFINVCTNEREQIGRDAKINYDIFLGHQIRLSTYFRHLYQTIKYINNQPSDVLSYDDKYEYIRMLRAQFSPHEQIMLFQHSLSSFGFIWEKKFDQDPNKQLITKYNLIRNIFFVDERMRKYYPCVEFENWPMPACREVLKKQYK